MAEKDTNSPPPFLVKYYKCDQYSFNTLRNRKIWASDPLKFNDPFDCAVQFWDIKSFSKENILQEICEAFPEMNFRNRSISYRRDFYFKNYLQTIGIFCLNDEKNKDIFWGYYSDQKGFSIKFDTEKLNKEWNRKPINVNYKSIEEIRSLRSELTDNPKSNTSNIWIWLTTKKHTWIQENEWRFIFPLDLDEDIPREKKIPLESIHEITLGFKFFNDFSSKYLKKGFFKYSFNIEDCKKFIYQVEILKILKDQINSPITQVTLDENYNLVHLPISILEINNNDLTIKYHFSEEQLRIMDNEN